MSLLLLLGACAVQPEQAPPVQPVALSIPAPSDLTSYDICMASLSEVGIDFEPVRDFRTQEGCGVTEGVQVRTASFGLTKPAMVTCPMAAALATFDYQVLRPLAEQHFGQEVRRVHHVGTYDCRPRRGGALARLSEHAHGKAIDIIAFDLMDGTRISVEKDWNGAPARAAFLQDVARAACTVFNVVLTPNTNRDHRDHLHLDIGPWKLCSV